MLFVFDSKKFNKPINQLLREFEIVEIDESDTDPRLTAHRIRALRLSSKYLGSRGISHASSRDALQSLRRTVKAKKLTKVLRSKNYPYIQAEYAGRYNRKNQYAILIQQIRRMRRARRVVHISERTVKGSPCLMIGGVHKTGGFFMSITKEIKKQRVFKNKTPKNKERHLGIEIEFLSPIAREEITDRIVMFGLEDSVCLKGDGSLRPKPNDYGHELCVLTTEDKKDELLIQVSTLLKSVDAYVNASCGLHVHLDMRSRDYAIAFNNLASAQAFLYAMNPKSRKNSQYCKPLKKREFYTPQSRYYGINPHSLNEHFTLEIRIHSGTINATKIKNWTDLLVKIVDAPKIPESIRSIKKLKEFTGIPESLARYIKKRIQKFINADTEKEEFECDSSFEAA